MEIKKSSPIFSFCQKERIDKIVIALDERRGGFPAHDLLECRLKGIEITDGVSFIESLTGKLSLENLYPSSLIFSNGFRGAALYKRVKRVMDILLSIVGMIIFGPFALLIAAGIKMESEGPILYTQERVGEDGKIFTIYKFRSMKKDAEKGGPVWAQVNDDRITRLGKILRRLRLDEVPQIINVLRGDMSFVGPRPERPFFVKKMEKEIPYYGYRHSVKPGITGWAQIYYSYGASMEESKEKLKFDLYYIKNLSPYLDLYAVLETMKIMILKRGSR